MRQYTFIRSCELNRSYRTFTVAALLYVLTFLFVDFIRASEPQPGFYRSMTVRLNPSGKCWLHVDSRMNVDAETGKTNSKAPLDVPALGAAEVFKADEGRLHVRYDFTKFKAIQELRSPFMTPDEAKMFDRVTLSKDETTLVLDPSPIKKVRWRYPRRFRGALDLKIEFAGGSPGLTEVRLEYASTNNENRAIYFALHDMNTQTAQMQGTVRIGMDKPMISSAVDAQHAIGIDQRMEFQPEKECFDMPGQIVINVEGGEPLAISKIEIITRILPSFGIEFMEDRTGVLVKRVLPKSAGEVVGLMPKDRVLSIDGIPVSSVAEALQLTSECPIDSELLLEMERGNQTQTLRISPK